METPPSETPNDVVLETAQTIVSDMKEMTNEALGSLDDYATILRNMHEALRETKTNLERHAIPMAKKKTALRRSIRNRIRSIEYAMALCKRLEVIMELSIEDIEQLMAPYAEDATDIPPLDILHEPTDEELRDIEGENPED